MNASIDFINVNGLNITSPLPGVWRLQSAGADDGRGVVQTLASLTGKTPQGVNGIQCLHRRDSRISNGGEDIEFTSDNAASFYWNGKAVLDLTRLLRDGRQISLEFGLTPDEALFGTGERFNGVNQRGKEINIWAEDKWCQTEGNSYLPIPFILSSRNYAVLLNRFEASRFDLGSTSVDHWSLTQLDAPLDVYFIFGARPADIYAKLVSLWGNPVVPPDWGWGTLVSRHLNTGEFATPDGIREMAARMKEHDLPWDAVIVEGWDTYNPGTYAALKEITAELARDHKKIMVYEACGRLPEPYWKSHRARPEYFIRDMNGGCEINEAPHFNPQDAPDRRHSTFVDITNPEAVKWWSEQVWRPLMECGVSGAKIDFCEQIPEDGNLIVHDGNSIAGLHHRYPVQYNLIMSQFFNKSAADGGLCWSRGGSTGAHLYPFVWSGDQLREFRFLKAVLSAILSAGISGVPFMGHDLGGYLPAENGDDEGEVFARGVEFSCFTATMSTHGKVTKPYDFASPYLNIYRFYSQVRYLLRPYLKEQAAICARTGLPLVRHLFLQYPENPEWLNCEDQYFFGEDMMVAPVLDHAGARSVRLPPGSWIELFSGKEYQGPSVLSDFPVSLSEIPVFVAAKPRSHVINDVVMAIRRLEPNGFRRYHD